MKAIYYCAVAAMSTLLLACGGGGGGSPPPEPAKLFRDALPPLSQDIPADGPATDYRSRNYFQMSPGDSWTYTRAPETPIAAYVVLRDVSAGSGNDLLVNERVVIDGVGRGWTYRRSDAGILQIQARYAGIPAYLRERIGPFLEYPEAIQAPGATRRVVRQGDIGFDSDGDRVNESYRFEFRQEFVGMESSTLAGMPVANIAHFRNVAEITIQPSKLVEPITTIAHREDTWWAPGVGLVRAERQAVVDAGGRTIDEPLSYVITQGTVAGEYVLQPPPDGSVVKVALLHSALVHDATRRRYYASVPSNGNRIATVDAITGAITYTAGAVGSEPAALAMAADDSALFVALQGSGEVAKLRLPDMAEQWRVRMPTTSATPVRVVRMAASPTEPDTVAVSLANQDFNATAVGVVLVRGGVVMPRRGGSENVASLVAFDADGRTLYGHGFDPTSYGLRRFSVLPDGLRLDATLPTTGDPFPQTLDWTPSGLVVDHSIYRASDLSLVVRVGVEGQSCRPLAGKLRLACPRLNTYSGAISPIVVVDASTGAVLAETFFERGRKSPTRLVEIVPGAPGSMALRMYGLGAGSPTDSVWLFSSPLLN